MREALSTRNGDLDSASQGLWVGQGFMNRVRTVHRGCYTEKQALPTRPGSVIYSLSLFQFDFNFTLLTKNSPLTLSSQAMKELKSSQLSVAHGPEEECEDKVHG